MVSSLFADCTCHAKDDHRGLEGQTRQNTTTSHTCNKYNSSDGSPAKLVDSTTCQKETTISHWQHQEQNLIKAAPVHIQAFQPQTALLKCFLILYKYYNNNNHFYGNYIRPPVLHDTPS